ncbi:MAG: hypothetical protein AB7F86_13610 [Bdellovibrionales bacterium]
MKEPIAGTQKLMDFLRELLVRSGQNPTFRSDEKLFLSGRLDSLAIVQLIDFLETEYSVDFSKRLLDPSDFESADRIRETFLT